MNIELTQEQKRIRIAGACGITDAWDVPRNPVGATACGWLGWSGDKQVAVPDYFGSLDAMHDALNAMTMDQCNDFNRLLIELRSDIPLENDGRGPQSLRWTWGQPAEVMAECFGRALKLW